MSDEQRFAAWRNWALNQPRPTSYEMAFNAGWDACSRHEAANVGGKGTPSFDAGYTAGLHDAKLEVMDMFGAISSRLALIDKNVVNSHESIRRDLSELSSQVAGEGNIREENHAELLSLVEAIHGAVSRPLHDAPVPESLHKYSLQTLRLNTDGQAWPLQDESGQSSGFIPNADLIPGRPDIIPAGFADLRAANQRIAELERRLIDVTKIATGAA